MELNKAGKLYSWGSNESGQLGVEGDIKSATPTLIPTPAEVRFNSVAANGSHTVAKTGEYISDGFCF